MDDPIVLITKQMLIDQEFTINKKFVMIDSRAYTNEAFEYVLKLADYAGSIVFVYDLKKIYANGRYFGGDVFQDDLNYFTKFITANSDGGVTGETEAVSPMSDMIFVGKSHLTATAKQYPDEFYKNVIEFDYNLKDAVNTDYITIGGVRYNLVVENDKIRLNEYVPFKVTCSSLAPREFDTYDWIDDISGEKYAIVSFNLNLSGTMPDPKKIIIEINSDTIPPENIIQNGTKIEAKIPMNTTATFALKYSDGITGGTTSVTQRWGYAIYVGIYDESIYAIDSFYSKDINFLVDADGDGVKETEKIIWVPGTAFNISRTISQNEYQVGLFICPDTLNVEFTDVSTNLTGGWTPWFDKIDNLYESETPYIPWTTDHKGLGQITWKIKG